MSLESKISEFDGYEGGVRLACPALNFLYNRWERIPTFKTFPTRQAVFCSCNRFWTSSTDHFKEPVMVIVSIN